jgi:hypothetical protein
MSGDVTPRYAVLFKTHFWDDFVARRFAALAARCPAADLWVAVDETYGPVADIPYDKVFRTRDSDMYALGLPEQPTVRINWYNVDYPLLAFRQAHAGHSFYIMVEYDVAVHCDLDALAAEALHRGVDLIAFPIRESVDDWGWTYTLEGVWPRHQILNRLLCISGFSDRAVAHLLTVRLDHAARYGRGEFQFWPFCEGFVPTALHEAGFTLESLTSFGATDCYEWWPPYHESELPDLSGQAFVHPVLTGPPYVTSLLRRLRPETWLTEPGSLLRRKLDCELPRHVVPALVEALIKQRNGAALIALNQVIDDRGWYDLGFPLAPLLRSFASPEPPCNLALRKFAYQSSVSGSSRDPSPAGDASRAVNGVISGDYGFHTNQETQPWWMVDLGQSCLVSEIRVYNRLTGGDRVVARANNLSIWSSLNGRGWDLVHRRVADTAFGGADGNPLVVFCPDALVARFVRIEIDGFGILHLDEVEIIGVKVLVS